MPISSIDPSRLLIAVDGGQSATLTILGTIEGEIVASAVSGPCNHIHEPGGMERQRNALRSGYENVFAAANLPLSKVACVFLGLTGSGNLDIARSVYETKTLILKGDAITALAGAIPSMVGTIIIAGTGSIAYGGSTNGQFAMAGGMGYFAGDEGSAYDIARRGFQAIYQARDKRSPDTMLTALFLEHFQCQNLHPQLHRRIYSGDLSRDQLAQASRLVGQAAAAGDAVAIQILAEAGRELGKTVGGVFTQLEQFDTGVPVAPIGGVFNAGDFITRPMLEQIHRTNRQAYLVKPRFVPVIGALLLALRELNVTLDDTIFSNIERTKNRIRSKN